MTPTEPRETGETPGGYTAEQREAIERQGAAGGVQAYLHRLSDGHRFTFYKDRVNGGIRPGICTCGELHCKGPYIGLYRTEMVASYEAKVLDFAAETRRVQSLHFVVRRMYDALAASWRGEHSEQTIREFYALGFPEGEREALLAALPQVERDWIIGESESSL